MCVGLGFPTISGVDFFFVLFPSEGWVGLILFCPNLMTILGIRGFESLGSTMVEEP